MRKMITRTGVGAATIAFGLMAQAGIAAAGTLHPMTFDECGTNGGTSVYNCMYISGGGLSATEIRGWSTDFGFEIGLWGGSWLVHEQVIGPNGTICNSDTSKVTKNGAVVGCQLQPGGSFPIAAGTYCSIVWSNDNGNGDWAKYAENCGTASA
jgi:hypothetical protein